MFVTHLESERDVQCFVGYQFLGFCLALLLALTGSEMHLEGLRLGGLGLGALHLLLFLDVRLVLTVHGGISSLLFFSMLGAGALSLLAGQDCDAMIALGTALLVVILGALNRRLSEAVR